MLKEFLIVFGLVFFIQVISLNKFIMCMPPDHQPPSPATAMIFLAAMTISNK